ncbi:MAG: undecaprenyl-diphosphate phosphatase, partial [Clostridia bacterium]|nr:undecaprenyl-diphosphate phosphatase [Clostridia bacterium]
MSIIQAIILGAVQGLTELLPISSSAHLFLVPWVFGWTNVEEFNIAFEAFDVALHAGTLLAIVIFFFKDWIKLIIGGFNMVFKKEKSFEGKMFWYLVLATIPGGAIGFVLDHFLEDALKNSLIIGICLIVMGIILYIVDKKAKSDVEYEDMTLKQTFLIGLSQALAFIPGVSRSGVTMTTGRMLGVKRESVAKYSFLLSTPIVAGATLYKLKDFVISVPFFIGIVTSFIVGIFVIKFLLEYLKKGSFKAFAIYRVIIRYS